MGFIKLDRYADPSGWDFDPEAVVDKARTAFADIKILPGDQLTLSADRAAAVYAPEHVVRSLRRNQQEFGPAYAFEIGTEFGGTVQGRGPRRYDVTFLFADPLTGEWRQRLLAFLQSLGPGRLEFDETDIAKPA